MDVMGLQVPVTAWRNVNESSGESEISISLPRFVALSSTLTRAQRDRFNSALFDSFARFWNEGGRELVEGQGAAPRLVITANGAKVV